MQEKYHISRAFTTVVVAHQECVKSQVFTHTKKRLNEFMMKSKLKQRSFAVGGGVGIQINERGSKNTRTM